MSQLTPSLHRTSSGFWPPWPDSGHYKLLWHQTIFRLTTAPGPGAGGWCRCYHDIKSIETPQLTQHTLLLLIPSQLCANVGWGGDRRLTHWRPLAWWWQLMETAAEAAVIVTPCITVTPCISLTWGWLVTRQGAGWWQPLWMVEAALKLQPRDGQRPAEGPAAAHHTSAFIPLMGLFHNRNLHATTLHILSMPCCPDCPR